MTVRCSVNNCHYWDTGNYCKAKDIMVTSDAMGDRMPDSFDAPRADNAVGTPVTSCMETCCKTFVQKGTGKERYDSIMRQ
ncbi:MAG TPA: DUF1540 domain-containing protein [Clostridia bacterium]|nr:DUF1540 domain-containing protein [Clostridia bacterium]